MSAVETSRTQPARSVAASARRAARSDVAQIAAMMGRAFRDDPLILFLVPDETKRASSLPGLFGLLLKMGLPFDACDVMQGYESAAIWRPPGKWRVPFWQYITNAPTFLSVFGTGCLRVMATMDQIESVHPHEPHWYLQAIGTDPNKQGKGYGGVVMRHQLAEIDSQGLPAYLESSKEKNIPLYASFGFELTHEIRIKDGPTLYAMWRKARP
jgi:ribosomal protein S18 acetylase RimI-like enzyme